MKHYCSPNMAGLSMMLCKSLAITPEGTCARHPHVLIYSNTEEIEGGGDEFVIRECELCWKDQQERHNQQQQQETGDEKSITLTGNSDHTSTTAGGASPPPPSGRKTAFAAGLTPKNGTSKAWIDSVNIRWTQLQESQNSNSFGGSFRKHHPMEDHSGKSTQQESWSGNCSINPMLNMSMAAVAEEPEERTRSSQTADTQTVNTNSMSVSNSKTTIVQLSRLEEKLQHQDESIHRLQDIVEQQEASIRQDLERLIKLVSRVAETQQQQLQQQIVSPPPQHSCPAELRLTGLTRRVTEMSAQTPVASNAHQRPTLYNKELHHPANIFTSVRTLERKPPKPPMRHGSFSTMGSARRASDSSKITGSILSSLGNSINDATTLNDTATNNDTTIHSISQKTNELSIEEEQDDIQWGAGFGPGIESMLEQERSKPLDIIFDASAAISADFLLEEMDALNQKFNSTNNNENKDKAVAEGDEEKKTSSASVSPTTSRKSPLPDGESREKIPSRNSFRKMQGSIHLDVDPTGDELDSKPPAFSTSFASAPELPSYPPPAGRFPKRQISASSPNTAKGLRQPQREKSVANVNVAQNERPAAPLTKPRLPNRSRNFTHPNKNNRYIPPPPPPGALPGPSAGANGLDRLNMKNLSKLGKSTAPPRREIFATGQSKIQISCLTIDTSLLSENEPAKPKYEKTAPIVYREVTNFPLIDKFGDKGIYSGTLREADGIVKHTQEKQTDNGPPPVAGIAHGGGTMKYEGGRYYRGEWRDGHWHGSGLLRNANGDSYEGDFVYDARHGHGIYKYENGDVYEGDFTEDKRHGKVSYSKIHLEIMQTGYSLLLTCI